MFHRKHRATYLLAVMLAMAGISGCGSHEGELPSASISATPSDEGAAASLEGLANPAEIFKNPPAAPAPRVNLHPHVLIRTNLGDIRVQLDAEKAPETVDNFLENYVAREFYKGTVFHYVDPEFVVAAGGFDVDLNPKQARAPIRNESGNGLKNVRGTIAMSRDASYADSATSQFFFNVTDNPALDQQGDDEINGYCVFGQVVEGMDIVDQIAQQPVEDQGDFLNVPVKPVTIADVVRFD